MPVDVLKGIDDPGKHARLVLKGLCVRISAPQIDEWTISRMCEFLSQLFEEKQLVLLKVGRLVGWLYWGLTSV